MQREEGAPPNPEEAGENVHVREVPGGVARARVPMGATGDAPSEGRTGAVPDRVAERRQEPLQPRPHTARRSYRVVVAGSSSRCPANPRCPQGLQELPPTPEGKLREVRANILHYIQRKVTDVEAANAAMNDIDHQWSLLYCEDQARVVHGSRHLKLLQFHEAACIQGMLDCSDRTRYFGNLFRTLLGLRCGPY